MQAVAATIIDSDTDDTESTSRIRSAPIRLPDYDVEELRWFARDELETGGLSGQLSAFGAMCEQLSLFSFGSKPCRKCGGTITRPGRGFVPRQKRLSYAQQLKRYRRRMMVSLKLSVTMTEAQAELLRLMGLDAYSRRAIAIMFPDVPPLLCRECPRCRGQGVLARSTVDRKRQLTARPTGGSRAGDEGGGGSASMAVRLLRINRIERRISAASRGFDDDVRQLVIEYFGQPKPYLFAPRGLVALWHRTRAGRQMLNDNRDQLAPHAFFAARLRAQHQRADRNRAGQHERADEEAQQLLDRVLLAWAEASW